MRTSKVVEVFAVATVWLMACRVPISAKNSAFYHWNGARVHCAINIDDHSNIDRADLDGGLDRARDRDEAIELYAHAPGQTIALAALETVLADAQARGLHFVTYADLATDRVPHTGSLVLSFDDNAVAAWIAARPLLQRYGVHATFFVSRYSLLQPEEQAEIAELASDGHGIEAHTVHHLHGVAYVEEHGLDVYINDEVQPSIDVLVNDGYPVAAFAYPFGDRTEEIDHAVLQRVQLVRAIASARSCPL